MRYKDRIEQIIVAIQRIISQLKDARDSENWAVISELVIQLEKQTDFLDNFIDLEEDELHNYPIYTIFISNTIGEIFCF